MFRNSTVTAALVAALIGLLAGPVAAQQQNEDERIMREDRTPVGGTSTPPPESEEDELDDQVFYSGMGVAQVDSGFDNLGEAINLEVVLGFRIPTVKWFGIEIDIGQTIIPGENETVDAGGPPVCVSDPIPVIDPDGTPNGCQPAGSGGQQQTRDRDEFGMQALGLSAVVKTTGRFYVTGRYGYRYLATSIDELNESRSGNGLGFGAGYRWGKGLSGVELSYKELSDQVDSVGLVFFARFNRR